MPENYILTSQGNFASANELYHYGVLGMKWGVRKGTYYNETHDTVGGNYTDRQKKRMVRQARSILKEQIRKSNTEANIHTKAANHAYKKADKLTRKSEARQNKGDQAGFNKYQSKAWKQVAKNITNTQSAKTAIAQSKLASKRLSEISDGTLQAGRDYVTNKGIYRGFYDNYYTVERRIDFRK